MPTLVQTGIGIGYGAVIGLLGFLFFFSALKKINASTASHLAYFEVVGAVLFGVILFHETLTWNVVVGGLLIICSIAFLKKFSRYGTKGKV